MAKVKREIYLNCSPEKAFNEISGFDFIKKMNSSAGVETKLIFQDERIIRYSITVENVGTWESERVLIPEKNLIITHRKSPLDPFKYMVVIYSFNEHPKGTQLNYMEEFEVEDKNIGLEKKILSNILEKVDVILNDISNHFI